MGRTHKSGIGATRRGALALLGLGGAAACAPTVERGSNTAQAARGTFEHGIASGDPRADSVILWTRVSPGQVQAGSIPVVWEIDTDPLFSNPLRGQAEAAPSRDFCVKVEAAGLQPGTDYHYRFTAGAERSATGRTRTLPEGETEAVRFAVVSCSNWEHGFFNVYDLIAKHAQARRFDALVHLGDYYYEYAASDYEAPNTPDARVHRPANEIVSLEDYRTRHAQYRTDPNLQAATAAMPLIALWDDHETANDSWKGGAENHEPDEGAWAARVEAALRAYWEWMPVREPGIGRAREQYWREYRFGDLLSLVAVETRLTARAEPLVVEEFVDEIVADPDAFKTGLLGNPDRKMFGDAQRDFIVDRLARSKADGVAWRMLANQVIMGRVITPDFTPYVTQEAVEAIEQDWEGIHDFLELSKYALPMYPDSWDGYPVAREEFFDALDAAGVNDVLVVTGDAHEFWANALTRADGRRMGAEFVTSSVSSKTLTAYLGDATAEHNLLLTRENEDVRYYNAQNNGYTEVEIRPRRAEVTMWAVDTVSARDYGAFRAAGFTVRPRRYDGARSLRIGRPRGLNLKQRVLFAGLA